VICCQAVKGSDQLSQMAAHGLDSHEAIQEQLQEQESALQEIEAALQHGEDAEMTEVSIQLPAG
jgi:hypothetical protein